MFGTQFSLYQFFVPLFACLMMAKAVSRFMRHSITGRELFVWLVVWCGISFGALFPDFSMLWLSKITGIKSGFNALIFFTLVVLVYGSLHLYVKLEEHERRLTELVRSIALKDFNKTGKRIAQGAESIAQSDKK